MTPGRKGLLLAAWLATVAGLGWVVERELVVGSDLRLFMPAPRTPEEKLLLEEIGEGPASRLLLLTISGAQPNAAADTSRALVAELREDREFRWIANGESNFDTIPEKLFAYRYLLSATLDQSRLDATFLAEQVKERLHDMTSPAAGLVETLLARDPTLELLNVAEAWQPPVQPQILHDVWFDKTGTQALLAVETKAPGFDPQGQRRAADALERAFKKTRTDPALRLTASGPGAFSVLMKDRTQGEAQRLGGLATIGMVALLLVAYRSFVVLALGLLPLISAGLAGLVAVGTAFGTVHGITLAFGFTLIGVAQDYPMHLFSHQHRGLDPSDNARALWPTLATGVASTCIAYLAFLFSGVGGLAQLSVFTVAGLAVAGLTTRFLLPPLLPKDVRDAADSAALGRIWDSIARLPRPLWLGVVVAVCGVSILVLSPRPLWQDALGGLTPVPAPLIERDSALRRELGAPDVRYMLVIQGSDAQRVLVGAAEIDLRLAELVARGSLDGYDHAARYLPTLVQQERRQASLPSTAELEQSLEIALRATPFRPDLFLPFVADVERARHLQPLGPDDLAGIPIDARVRSLLLKREGHWTGLVTLTGLRDPAALRSLIAEFPDVTLLDLKQASESLVAHQRTRILYCLAAAAVLLVLVVAFALRDASRVRRVLAPMALTTLIVLAGLHAAGVSLTLFHLIALVLAAGLGLDYALFFEHAADAPAEQRRTLHAVLVCAISTLMVFAVLALSSLPVLRAIGLTVSAGVICNFILALLLTRPQDRSA